MDGECPIGFLIRGARLAPSSAFSGEAVWRAVWESHRNPREAETTLR